MSFELLLKVSEEEYGNDKSSGSTNESRTSSQARRARFYGQKSRITGNSPVGVR